MMRSSRALPIGGSILLLAAVAIAQQVPPGGFQQPGASPRTPAPAPQVSAPASQGTAAPTAGATGTFGLPSGQQQGPDEFSSIWSTPSRPRGGFPVFPSQLSGYGNYPLPSIGGEGAVSTQDPLAPVGLPLPPAEPEPPRWPSWVRLAARRPLPYAVDVGLLIAQGERVWHRPAAGEPFVPLMFYDKFASLPVGAEAEVRQTGAFEVLLHQSTRIETRGPTHLRVEALSEQAVEVAFEHLTWLRVQATGRRNALRLPDGSVLEIAPPSATPAGAVPLFGLPLQEPPKPALVELRRSDEPGWYGGRATIDNLGGRDVVWRHAFGETVIAPSQRVTFFLTPPVLPGAWQLSADNIDVNMRGDRAECRARTEGAVQWCGARFSLPRGTRLTLESLGAPFTAKPAAGSADADG